MNEFEIRETGKYSKGLFTLRHFEKDQIIIRLDGKKIPSAAIPELGALETYAYIQTAQEWYLNIEGHNGYFVNHSCNPNVGVKIFIDTAFLVALKPIKPEEELVFDYSTTSTETLDTFKIECSCGNYGCRKVISGFGYLSDADKKKYVEMNAIPDYIKKIFNV